MACAKTLKRGRSGHMHQPRTRQVSGVCTAEAQGQRSSEAGRVLAGFHLLVLRDH